MLWRFDKNIGALLPIDSQQQQQQRHNDKRFLCPNGRVFISLSHFMEKEISSLRYDVIVITRARSCIRRNSAIQTVTQIPVHTRGVYSFYADSPFLNDRTGTCIIAVKRTEIRRSKAVSCYSLWIVNIYESTLLSPELFGRNIGRDNGK